MIIKMYIERKLIDTPLPLTFLSLGISCRGITIGVAAEHERKLGDGVAERQNFSLQLDCMLKLPGKGLCPWPNAGFNDTRIGSPESFITSS